jgi:hypothetical protein
MGLSAVFELSTGFVAFRPQESREIETKTSNISTF